MKKFVLQVFNMRVCAILSQAMFLREKKKLKYRTSHYTSVNDKNLYLNSSHRALCTSVSDS